MQTILVLLLIGVATCFAGPAGQQKGSDMKKGAQALVSASKDLLEWGNRLVHDAKDDLDGKELNYLINKLDAISFNFRGVGEQLEEILSNKTGVVPMTNKEIEDMVDKIIKAVRKTVIDSLTDQQKEVIVSSNRIDSALAKLDVYVGMFEIRVQELTKKVDALVKLVSAAGDIDAVKLQELLDGFKVEGSTLARIFGDIVGGFTDADKALADEKAGQVGAGKASPVGAGKAKGGRVRRSVRYWYIRYRYRNLYAHISGYCTSNGSYHVRARFTWYW